MKKRLISKQRLQIAIILFLTFIYQPISAQSADTNSILNKILFSINALVWTAANYIFQPPPNVGTEVVNNYAQTSAFQIVPNGIRTLNSQDIVSGLTPNSDSATLNLTRLATVQASDTIVSGLTAGGAPVPFFSQASQQNIKNSLTQGNENFNFQSLINPSIYETSGQQNKALNFIRFVSNYATPISNINLGSYPESQLSMQQKLTIQNSGAYQAFAVQRRQLIAQQSAILTNLYWIYSKRLPVQSLNPSDVAIGTMQRLQTTANVPNNAPQHPSAQEIAEFTANWRTSNRTLAPQWYAQMSVASPANVQREQLFVLVEIESMMSRLLQDNERIIALLALTQLQELQAAKTNLQMTESKIKNIIENQIRSTSQEGIQQINQTPQSQNANQQAQSSRLKGASQNVEQQSRQEAKQQANTRSQ